MNTEIQPLYASFDQYPGYLWLGHDIIRWPMARHCDESMPSEDRERVAAEIASHTREPDFQIKSVSSCKVCRKTLTVELRLIEGDTLANLKPIVFPAEALAHYVRHHGLRIDPRLLASHFGCRPDGSRASFWKEHKPW